jgi:hypothetical protein
VPLLLPGARCALTAPFHPCLCPRLAPRAIGGLLSAALSVASRRPGVTRHPALWSSDFPRHPRVPRSSLASQPTFSYELRAELLAAELQPRASRLAPGGRAVPRRGLEPPRRFRHQILSLACLPVSAPGQPTFRAIGPRARPSDRRARRRHPNPRGPHRPDDAPERTRTSTGLRPLDPESSASTSSATGAYPAKVRPERFELPAF